MSRSTTDLSNRTPRLALMAGSAIAMGASLLLTPGQAQAQCTPSAPAAGPGADVINCVTSTTAYAPAGTNGIVFTSSGDLTVNLTGSGNANLGSGGASLTAGGTNDNLNFNLTTGGITGTGNTASAIVNLLSQDGDINVVLGNGTTSGNGGVSGATGSVQYGLRARSSGTGDITVSTTSNSGISTGTGATNPGIAAMEVTSNGGDISITGAGFGTQTGRLYGIRTSTTGDGDLTITRNLNPGTITTGSAGIAGIDASVGNGLLRLNLEGNVTSGNNTSGVGVRATAIGGDILINKVGGGSVSGGGGSAGIGVNALDLVMGGGLATINNNSSGPTSGYGAGRANGLLQATGSGEIVFNNNTGMTSGLFRLAGFNGDVTFNNASGVNGWETRGENFFAQGVNTINNLQGAVMSFGYRINSGNDATTTEIQTTTLHFQNDADTINNRGTLAIGIGNGVGNLRVAQLLDIQGLGTFNNYGTIVLGAREPLSASSLGLPSGTRTYAGMPSDGFIDDTFRLRDSTFIGHEGSQILLDANLNAIGQTSCERIVPGLAPGIHPNSEAEFPANECLDMQGTDISGRTEIVINDAFAGDRGAYNPEGNVIVDFAGGSAEPGSFVVGPGSVGYSAEAGGIADKGLFVYLIAYDGDDEVFRLHGIESPGSQQFPLLGQAANELWRTATASWYERQVEMRSLADGQAVGGTWVRGVFERGERDAQNVIALGSGAFAFDNSHTQDRGAVTLGRDWVIGGDSDTSGLVGVMVGYARNRISFDHYANTANFEGPSAGVYGGLTAGAFYVDAAVNGVWSVVDNDIPTLTLAPVGTVLSTDAESYGAQVETGWRMDLGLAQLTPLAGVSWASSTIGTIDVPAADPLRLGGEVAFEDIVSLRTSLGARVSASDLMADIAPTSVSLTARAVQENDGESAVSIVNLGPTANLSNVFDGTFGEVNAAVAVGSQDGAAAGYLNIGGLFGDGYRSVGASLGFRYQW